MNNLIKNVMQGRVIRAYLKYWELNILFKRNFLTLPNLNPQSIAPVTSTLTSDVVETLMDVTEQLC